jgi:biopolymer transport protein ExbB/TolQ
VSETIRRVNARKEAQRIADENRAHREARQAQAAQLRQAMPEIGTVVMPQMEKKFQVTFTVTATMPMLRGLKAWLEDKKIEYQEVT